jgi:hypothetical protein
MLPDPAPMARARSGPLAGVESANHYRRDVTWREDQELGRNAPRACNLALLRCALLGGGCGGTARSTSPPSPNATPPITQTPSVFSSLKIPRHEPKPEDRGCEHCRATTCRHPSVPMAINERFVVPSRCSWRYRRSMPGDTPPVAGCNQKWWVVGCNWREGKSPHRPSGCG